MFQHVHEISASDKGKDVIDGPCPHIQANAITTLRSGKIIDNRVGLGMSVKDVSENVEEETLIEEELREDPPSPPSSPLSTPQMSKYVPRVPFSPMFKRSLAIFKRS